MLFENTNRKEAGIFITFSGNCRKALTFYQSCFGGILQFEDFDKRIAGYKEIPVVSGSLVSDRIVIYGSDLVHEEGRKTGNYLSIFLFCKEADSRDTLVKKLSAFGNGPAPASDRQLQLIEIIDAFDVRWMLGI